MNRGAFIVMEGVDFVGKSTQARMLQDFLMSQNRFPPPKIVHYDFFTNITVTEKIKRRLSSHVMCSGDVVRRPIFEAATTIISDRYAYHEMALNFANGRDYQPLKSELLLMAPDLVFFFDIDPSKASKRPGFGNSDIQKRVRDVYLKQLVQPGWVVIDATQPIKQIHKIVAEKTLTLFRNGLPPIQPLKWL